VNGEKHLANMSDPLVPAALAPAIIGILSLNDFKPRAMNRTRTEYIPASGFQLVVPEDVANIYNLTPLFAAGYSGQGQTVVVIEDSDVYSASDWDTFRATFGLAAAYPQGSFVQVHPAGNGLNSCTDPGPNGDDPEAAIDAEWASAAAPSATIELASCQSTTGFGGFIALQNLLNSTPTPAIVSISYGEDEPDIGSAANAGISALYQQGAAEGVSIFVSSGDQGGAASDRHAQSATHGITVSGFASTLYNVAVGGTDFADLTGLTPFSSNRYWATTNSPNYGSALGYVPEIPWNDSCASGVLASYLGGPLPFSPNGLCNSSFGQQYFLTTAAAGGGPSACATGAPAS
jgi:subtilase family serine protease